MLGLTVLINESHFFILLLFILWLFLISLFFSYDSYKKGLLIGISLFLFGISFTLSIMIATISFNYPFGFVVVFMIPIFSLYLIAYAYYGNRGN